MTLIFSQAIYLLLPMTLVFLI